MIGVDCSIHQWEGEKTNRVRERERERERKTGSEGHTAEWCFGEAIKRDSNFARKTSNRQNIIHAFLFLYVRDN